MDQARYKALDSWRGVAAVMVVIYRLPITTPMDTWPNWKAMELCVDFFFVLSGFVIMHGWGARLTTLNAAFTFMKRRFWRLWPLHIAVLSVFVAIEVLRFGVSIIKPGLGDQPPFSGFFSLPKLVSNLFLVQSMGLHQSTSWNDPSWSISVEFWTYLVFALVMVLFRGRFPVMIAIAACSLAIVLAVSPLLLFSTYDFGFFRCLYGFFTGAILNKALAGTSRKRAFGFPVELGVVALVGLFMASTTLSPRMMIAPLVFAALIFVFSRSQGPITRLLETRPFAALGLWSYSIYLVHELIFYIARILFTLFERITKTSLTVSGEGGERMFSFGAPILDGVAVLFLIGLTIALSAHTYHFIERRFMKST